MSRRRLGSISGRDQNVAVKLDDAIASSNRERAGGMKRSPRGYVLVVVVVKGPPRQARRQSYPQNKKTSLTHPRLVHRHPFSFIFLLSLGCHRKKKKARLVYPSPTSRRSFSSWWFFVVKPTANLNSSRNQGGRGGRRLKVASNIYRFSYEPRDKYQPRGREGEEKNRAKGREALHLRAVLCRRLKSKPIAVNT